MQAGHRHENGQANLRVIFLILDLQCRKANFWQYCTAYKNTIIVINFQSYCGANLVDVEKPLFPQQDHSK